MTHLRLALAAAFCLAMSPAQAAGLKFLHIPVGQDDPAIDAAMWSPCTEVPEDVQIRALTIPAVPDCPIAGEKLPLVIISHGYGGWYLGHHDTAEALADSGFVVVAINHPYANYADMSRANGLGVLAARPVDIKRTIDFMLTDFPDSAKIDPQRIGFYGFSQGGYTGLVLAGANPDFSKLPRRCADPKAVGCPQANRARPPQQPPLPQTLTHDPRIRAMVVADPLSIVFQTTDSVKAVTIPLQLWGSELGGGGGASPENVATLARVLPEKPDFRIVPNAVHLSFLTMCPKTDLSSEACIDAPGFDRAAFHREFNAEVVAFFRRNLGK
ncbi:putative dienelactone hydrolase [Rhizobium leguminosarum]|uniref:Dienelactone hydrolase n=1 Tax=Rhizobium leguminosarum TaxID=384 RepID=A0AAE2MKZ4_RHILE|nr:MULTISPECIES: alpha/beta fold hydrolase [Rhizobium]MBB4291035.1 putative dienelactone hydrolase [Rhizobium leguminosarum]MBB4297869.1 putative dienelactone hydrolase [Rhizobium leguminosarum]MBB4309008.1 putative dienelactone hydrolase [Rhizobium leguminosarum]MBB4416845.1 putative dienelactone hydrolase [Rhizobium leguminosarum]MBB4430186.1 putative dienelactone hydrolase [Rhizobium esperanzae]